MSFILLLIVLMLACDLLWWWRAHRALERLRRRRLWRSGLGLFMAGQLACFVWILLGRISSDRSDELLPKFALAGVFLWHFILLPLGVMAMLVEVGNSAIARFNRRPADDVAQPDAADAVASDGPTRRGFLLGVAVAAPPALTVAATGFSLRQLDRFRILPLGLAHPQLPEALDGLTIAHVSDIHVGGFTSGAVLNRIVDATNALRTDLVLLTGDLINHALSDLPAGLDIVKRMDARYGIWMCEGNHDLIENRREFEQTVRSSGVPLLVNESTMLRIRGQDVQLLGLRWGGSGVVASNPPARGDAAIADSMRVLLPQRRPDAFPILLAHHPHAFDLAAGAGFPLTLSGHTHGGQLMATADMGFGPLMFRYWSGLYQKGDSKLVVSNGVGNWFPMRINAPAEIVQITLHRRG